MEFIIKDLARKDFSKAIDFAIEGMHFNRYLDNKCLLRLYGRYFLYLEMERATQILAAYTGGRLAGVLIADMENEPKPYFSFWRSLYVKVFKALMKLAVKNGQDIYNLANKAMFEEFTKKGTPDGEICFLAADPAIHGKGIGTKLLDEFSRREKGKRIYLYTDDNCTYQFYEHKGFKRAEKKEIKIECGGKVVPLTCLLYCKQL